MDGWTDGWMLPFFPINLTPPYRSYLSGLLTVTTSESFMGMRISMFFLEVREEWSKETPWDNMDT